MTQTSNEDDSVLSLKRSHWMPPFIASIIHDDSLHAGLATFLSSLGTVRVGLHLSVKYRWKKAMSE